MTDMNPVEPTERRGSPTRTLLMVVGVIMLIGAFIAVFAGALRKGDPAYDASPLLGKPLPDFDLPRLDGGGEVSFDDLRGEVLVINFWASWCDPCKDEHPNLVAASAAYSGRGVRFVGIVRNDTDAAAKRFLDVLGWGGDAYLHLSDPGSRAAIGLGVYGQPETYFVDVSGMIVHKTVGPSSFADLSTRLDEILADEAGG